ncbi:hypothetical protein EV644_10383 [Kribbella orskensis]|uniref:Uncharacterized protein n=1 Tax=Kribbella orskensis TaxID=2512216 RepID=A0ABY2BPW5_9ACTN|nr:MULTISPECIES: hypothetical protein [Kribbella]TCN39831.1 hypothetical protein EV642_106337 [Kribbella sp. VKM Ac-2500]TCO27386.1 hypothetical protein EV644_10383 [Kribbella orskensis]
MRTLTTTLKALLQRLNGDSPQSPKGFALRLPALPTAAPLPGEIGVPLGIDAAGQPVSMPRGASVLIAGDPRTHVLTALRTLALGHARFPGTRLHVYDPNVLGDLVALRGLAHRYIDTSHGGATIHTATNDLRDLADLIRRRRRRLDDLNRELAAAEPAIRRATGQPAPVLTDLRDIHAVPQRVWAAAGIHSDRVDSDTADLHPHVVVIGHAIRWALSEDDGTAFTTMLTRVARRGHGLGVTVLLGADSAYLPYLPADLLPAFRHRVALGLDNPDHADQVLGALARQSGVDPHPDRRHRPGQGWLAELGADTEPRYLRIQVYDANPHAFRADCIRLTRTRARNGWLTGDAANTRGGRR